MISTAKEWATCPQCGDDVHAERWALGYRLCLWCGEEAARLQMEEAKVKAKYRHTAHRANRSYRYAQTTTTTNFQGA